jgi:hypothetical protein
VTHLRSHNAYDHWGAPLATINVSRATRLVRHWSLTFKLSPVKHLHG